MKHLRWEKVRKNDHQTNLNKTYFIDKKDSICQLRFTLKTVEKHAVQFYYYPVISAEGFSNFDTYAAFAIG